MLKTGLASEKTLEKKLREGVKKRGGLCLKWVSPGFTGVPDRKVLMPGGRIWFVEVKSEGRTPTPRQRAVIAMLQKLGFSVWVIDQEETLRSFLKVIE